MAISRVTIRQRDPYKVSSDGEVADHQASLTIHVSLSILTIILKGRKQRRDLLIEIHIHLIKKLDLLELLSILFVFI